MPLRCTPTEVAIYLPPRQLDVRDSDQSLRRCQAFLEAIQAGSAALARVFDDRGATITFEEHAIWGPKAHGEVPAYDALEGESSVRVVVIPHPHAIGRLPKPNTSRVEAFAQVFVAEPALVETPDAVRLDSLSAGDLESWRPILETVAYQVTKGPLLAPSPLLVQALLAHRDLRGWCELAATVAPELFSSNHISQQAVTKFEGWLRDAMTGVELPTGPEDRYRVLTDLAYDALDHLEWDEVATHARAAIEAAAGTGESPIEARRLAAAAQLAQLDFDAGLRSFGAQLLLEAVFGRPWIPSRRPRFPLDLAPLDEALHHAAWLCTRIESTEDPSWVQALDTLEAVLPSDSGDALRSARAANEPRTRKPEGSDAKKPATKKTTKKPSTTKKKRSP